MTSNPAQREAGTAGWRMEQARAALGFSSVKAFADHLGVGVSNFNKCRRDFEMLGRRQRDNMLNRFRATLPEGFAEYIEDGGTDQPPEAAQGWQVEVAKRQREMEEYSESFNEAVSGSVAGAERFQRAELRGPAVSPRKLIREIMEDFGLNLRDATAYALLELAGQGRGDLVKLFDRYFEQMGAGAGAELAAAEQRGDYLSPRSRDAGKNHIRQIAGNGQATPVGESPCDENGRDVPFQKVVNGQS